MAQHGRDQDCMFTMTPLYDAQVGANKGQYTFTLTEVNNWIGGDGRPKVKAMLVNGQFPGPTITGNWGDRITINVINTSAHYKGISEKRQELASCRMQRQDRSGALETDMSQCSRK